jgi:hypothetical protein
MRDVSSPGALEKSRWGLETAVRCDRPGLDSRTCGLARRWSRVGRRCVTRPDVVACKNDGWLHCGIRLTAGLTSIARIESLLHLVRLRLAFRLAVHDWARYRPPSSFMPQPPSSPLSIPFGPLKPWLMKLGCWRIHLPQYLKRIDRRCPRMWRLFA